MAGAGILRVSFVGGEEEVDKEADSGARIAREMSDSEATDVGGPRREFFRLLLQEIIHKSGLMEGRKSAINSN